MNNSLAEVHPELIVEWSEENLPLTPDDITFGSNKKVWWKGACGHEWQTSVKARSNGEKCPICSGARVIAGINDLATLEPLLAKHWSITTSSCGKCVVFQKCTRPCKLHQLAKKYSRNHRVSGSISQKFAFRREK